MKLDLVCPSCVHCLTTATADDFVPQMGKVSVCKHCGDTVEVVKKNLHKHLSPEQRQKAIAMRAKAKAALAAENQTGFQPKPAATSSEQTRNDAVENTRKKTAKSERPTAKRPHGDRPRGRRHKKQEKRKGVSLWWLVIVSAAVVALVANSINSPAPAASTAAPKASKPQAEPTAAEIRQRNEDRRRASVITYCEKEVKSRLISPNSADFAWLDRVVKKMPDNLYVVNSYVDAKNAFNAEIRVNWRCFAKDLGGLPENRSNWDIQLEMSE